MGPVDATASPNHVVASAPMRTRLALALIVALLSSWAALFCAPVSAQSGQPSPLGGRIADLVREAALGDGISVQVQYVDGRPIADIAGETLRNPASNMKLVTAAAALLELGPEFHMTTSLSGRVQDGRIAHLVVRGTGDPGLRFADLVDLAEGLVDRGVRAVDRIYIDGSYFDNQVLPPAFEQQPNEVAPFRAAIGAVAVERSAYVLRVIPAAVGAVPTVRLGATGYFVVDNQMTTSEAGAPNVIAAQSEMDDGRLSLRLRGTVPAGILGVGYRRRIAHPIVHAGYAMKEALERVGIGGRRAPQNGRVPTGLPQLNSLRSRSVAELLHRVGKHSDNFVAEMILKVIAAEREAPGSSQRGAEILQEVLTRAGVTEGATTIVNGSGLFDGNQIASAHLVTLLKYMYAQRGVRNEYLSHLAIGGVDGTLRRRLRQLRPRRIVRAKTGTLNDVISLSGYVLGEDDEHTVAFSFLANGIRGKQGVTRRLADSIVTVIAEELY